MFCELEEVSACSRRSSLRTRRSYPELLGTHRDAHLMSRMVCLMARMLVCKLEEVSACSRRSSLRTRRSYPELLGTHRDARLMSRMVCLTARMLVCELAGVSACSRRSSLRTRRSYPEPLGTHRDARPMQAMVRMLEVDVLRTRRSQRMLSAIEPEDPEELPGAPRNSPRMRARCARWSE